MSDVGVEPGATYKASSTGVYDKPECTCNSTGGCQKHPYAPNGAANMRAGQEYFDLLQREVAIRVREARSPHQDVMLALPDDAAGRKAAPICSGVLDYFPAALVEVARLSKAGNDQHNPGELLHWARGKSADHADCIVRHLMQRGTNDTDGVPHSAKVAWRALALLQEELEAAAGFIPNTEGK